jgi:CBS domain-containing protein
MKSIQTIIGEQDTITVERNASVADAARLMASHNIGAVPVMDDGKLVGIFTERDVLTRIVAAVRNPESTKVGEVMSTTLVTADLSEHYDACLNRMQEEHVRHLLVLDGRSGGLAGVLSLRDVLAACVADKSDEVTFLSAYVQGS